MGIFEKHAFLGDAVDVRRLDDVVQRALAIELLINAGIAPHVISEAEEDVWTLGLRSGEHGRDQETQSEDGEETHGRCR